MKSLTLFLALSGLSLMAEPTVEPARIVRQEPMKLQRSGGAIQADGVVRLEVTVNAKGRVDGVKILEGRPDLLPTAILMVRRWEYAPARVDGRAVSGTVNVDLKFGFAG